MTVQDYMNLPYTIKIKFIEDESGKYYYASIDELYGCWADGKTLEKAIASLKDAMKLWIEIGLEDGFEIPLPKTENEYSGKFVLRLPKSLHFKLAQKAEEEGISLNQ